MSNPKRPEGMQVDPSEDAIDERGERTAEAGAAEDEDSAMLEVDPSEEPSDR